MAKQRSVKEPTRREAALNRIMVAAYHTGSGVGAWFGEDRRLVSYAAMREAAAKGIRAKERGVKCNCFECAR